MIQLDTQHITIESETLIPLTIAPPVQRGSIDVWLSKSRGGPPIHSTLARAIVIRDGTIRPFRLFGRDLRQAFPKGGRCWLVVSYAGRTIACGQLELIAP